jgi:hypothetical protein
LTPFRGLRWILPKDTDAEGRLACLRFHRSWDDTLTSIVPRFQA